MPSELPARIQTCSAPFYRGFWLTVSFMELTPGQITIAITAFNRRQFVHAAIRSALDQTVPVRVVVVENCSPDPQFRDFVLAEFGDRIEYFRNSRNRGMFDNWNACLEYCRTPWLSILHDDDLLRPNFVETILQLARTAPGRALYFGRWSTLQEAGQTLFPPPPVAWPDQWRDLAVQELAEECIVSFPGQLIRVAAAREVGGFRPHSYFTGDWDMWFRLTLRFGAAQTAVEVAVNRSYHSLDRGSSRVELKGWQWALDNAQRKRNLRMLEHERGLRIAFDRTKFLQVRPIPSRNLTRFAPSFSRRILSYNAWLFTRSRAPNRGYRLLQSLVRLFGPGIFRLLSWCLPTPRR